MLCQRGLAGKAPQALHTTPNPTGLTSKARPARDPRPYKLTLTHTHTSIHAYTYTHIHSHMYTQTNIHSLTHAQKCGLTRHPTLTHTHTHTPTHTHAYTRTLTRTHTHTHTHTHKHGLTRHRKPHTLTYVLRGGGIRFGMYRPCDWAAATSRACRADRVGRLTA